jgi:hypothetical protein
MHETMLQHVKEETKYLKKKKEKRGVLFYVGDSYLLTLKDGNQGVGVVL